MKSTTQKSSAGSGVVEYVLITALVAIMTIAIFKTFRGDVTEAYKKAGESLLSGVQETGASAEGQ